MKGRKFFFFLFCLTVMHSFIFAERKEHEIWWENTLGETADWNTFSTWLGDENSDSRLSLYHHLIKKKYSSILDVPCGLCVDFWGCKKYGIDINYTGLDITPKLINRAKKFCLDVSVGSIENIPFPQDSFDICFSRHIL